MSLKIYRFVLPLLLGGILFGVILSGAMIKWQTNLKSQDPLTALERATGNLETGGERKTFLDLKGVFIILFPSTKLIWEDSFRELTSGEAWIGATFIAPKNYVPNAQNPKIPSEEDLGEGSIKVGAWMVRFGPGSVFLERDPSRKISTIWAVDQEIDIFWEGRTQPFVIPPGMVITLQDGQSNSNNQNLYYSKLKKKSEFRLESFASKTAAIPPKNRAQPNLESPEEKIKWAEAEQEKLQEASFLALGESIKILAPYEVGGRLAKTRHFLEKTALTFDFFTPKSRQFAFDFSEKIEPFLRAYFSLSRQSYEEARGILASWNEDYEKQFIPWLESSGEFRERWDILERTLFSWSRKHLTIPQGEIYFSFWTKSPTNLQAKIHQSQALLEYGIKKQDWGLLESALEGLESTLNYETDLPPEIFTRLRRILSEWIQIYPELEKNEKSLQVLVKLSEKEIDKMPSGADKDEIILESAQDFLDLLYKLIIQKSPSQDSLSLLENHYKKLNPDQIIKSLGRIRVFDAKQLEMIRFMHLGGNGGLDLQKLEALKKQSAYFQKLEESLKKDKNNSNSSAFLLQNIDDEKSLKSFFVVVGVNTNSLELTDLGDKIRFEKGVIANQSLEGLFYFQGQFFQGTTMGGEVFERLNLEEFQKAIQRAKVLNQQIISDQSLLETSQGERPQDTPSAKLERLSFQQKLADYGFLVDFESIKILDDKAQFFLIKGASSSGENWSADFEYSLQDQKASKIYIKRGQDTENIIESLSLKDLRTRLSK